LALDVGNVRIGVAASDPTQTISTPLNSLTRKNSISEIKEICSDRGIVLILVGMPYLPSGKLGTQARITEAFINELKISIEIPIQTADERMTTIEAKIRLKESGYKNISKAGNKGIIDSAAAAVLLDEYISSL
jgi:putative Holliday junction resolvase|tara:strand:- start:380 stop:778 length:399 start_codon:yes stop_codon:yes gene_type:complete